MLVRHRRFPLAEPWLGEPQDEPFVHEKERIGIVDGSAIPFVDEMSSAHDEASVINPLADLLSNDVLACRAQSIRSEVITIGPPQ